MPAYNAEKTLKKTYDEIPKDIVDDIILTDDASQDKTVKLARELNIKTFVHTENRGYGGNQKTCYQAALKSAADIVIMLHPDYQYNPKLIIPMTYMIAEGVFDAVIASRILGNKAMMGGMPLKTRNLWVGWRGLLNGVVGFENGIHLFCRELFCIHTPGFQQNYESYALKTPCLIN